MDREKDSAMLLDEEIAAEIENLARLTPGSKEHTAAVESLNKLYVLSLEETRGTRELRKISEQSAMDEREYQRKVNEEKSNKVARVVGWVLDVLGIVAPLVSYGAWINKGLKFEESGSFCSTTFRNLIGKIRPGK